MPVVNRVRINSTLSKETNDILNKISEETKINKSRLIDMAIELLQKEYESKRVGL